MKSMAKKPPTNRVVMSLLPSNAMEAARPPRRRRSGKPMRMPMMLPRWRSTRIAIGSAMAAIVPLVEEVLERVSSATPRPILACAWSASARRRSRAPI